MRPALLLIDLQHDYLSSPALEPGREAVCAAAAELLGVCRAAAVPVMHIWTTIRRDGERMPHWQAASIRRCVEGTPGHAAPAALQPRTAELIVHKRFYSAFASTDLEAHIRELAVDTLILAGVHLRACVRTTAIDAYQRQLSVWIADDAVADDDPLHAAVTRQYLSRKFVRFEPVERLRQLIPSRSPAAATVSRGDAGPLLPALWVAGQPRESRCAEDISHVSPRNGRDCLFRVPVCDESLIAEAVADARRAQLAWSHSRDAERREALETLAAKLEQHAESLSRQIATDIGKPLHDARLELSFAVDLVRSAVFAARPAEPRGGDWRAQRRPLGVVAVVTPWNNPLAIALGKIAPAILHGNAVVWKPALPGAAAALAVLPLLQQCGLPPGLVNLVQGDGGTAERLIGDEGIEAVTLTGSSRSGLAAQLLCARRRIPFQAELGGNNAAVVWSDADLEQAASHVALGAFGCAGQRCTAARRVIVDRRCAEDFLRLLQGAAALLRWGDPLREATQVGPVVSAAALRRIAGAIDRARGAGAAIHVAHEPSDLEDACRGGFYAAPTIVCCDDPGAEVVGEETFGPLLVLQTASSWEEAIQRCNGVAQGLVASLFSGSPARQRDFLVRASAGILRVNGPTSGVAADAPFGGWKASGSGPPEHGLSDVEFYTKWQTIYRFT